LDEHCFGFSRRLLQSLDTATRFEQDTFHHKKYSNFHINFRDGRRGRPYDTVEPLARHLGIEIDDSIHRDNERKAAHRAMSFEGPGNVLICWQHTQLEEIADALGVRGYARETGESGRIRYGHRWDLIWVVPYPWDEITELRSECVPGLDDDVCESTISDTDVLKMQLTITI
jgi:hypothetical protein